MVSCVGDQSARGSVAPEDDDRDLRLPASLVRPTQHLGSRRHCSPVDFALLSSSSDSSRTWHSTFGMPRQYHATQVSLMWKPSGQERSLTLQETTKLGETLVLNGY